MLDSSVCLNSSPGTHEALSRLPHSRSERVHKHGGHSTCTIATGGGPGGAPECRSPCADQRTPCIFR